MKSLKLIAIIILIGACSSFAQTPATTPQTAPVKQMPPATVGGTQAQQMPGGMPMNGQPPVKMVRYMVTIPHTAAEHDQVINEMKQKAGPLMMRFDWGCASGQHIGYAMMGGADEEAVRKQLPEGLVKMAKFTKVDKINAATQYAPMQAAPSQMDPMKK